MRDYRRNQTENPFPLTGIKELLFESGHKLPAQGGAAPDGVRHKPGDIFHKLIRGVLLNFFDLNGLNVSAEASPPGKYDLFQVKIELFELIFRKSALYYERKMKTTMKGFIEKC